MAPPRKRLVQALGESNDDFSSRSAVEFAQEQRTEEVISTASGGAAEALRALLDVGQRKQSRRAPFTFTLDVRGVELLDEMASHAGVNRCRVLDALIFGAAKDVSRLKTEKPEKGWSTRLAEKLIAEGPNADLSEFDQDEDEG